jgi:hypothetical protein
MNLSVLHDNQSRQDSVQPGMEVLIESRLRDKRTDLIIRATVLSTHDTARINEQKGRLCMVLTDLIGYLNPSEEVKTRINGDLEECCYPDRSESTMSDSDLVGWICSSGSSFQLIFSPVVSDKGRWYPKKKNEGSGFRSLPAMFRSMGVGYMKLGDINSSKDGNQFLSLDNCRTFLNEDPYNILRSLELDERAVDRCVLLTEEEKIQMQIEADRKAEEDAKAYQLQQERLARQRRERELEREEEMKRQQNMTQDQRGQQMQQEKYGARGNHRLNDSRRGGYRSGRGGSRDENDRRTTRERTDPRANRSRNPREDRQEYERQLRENRRRGRQQQDDVDISRGSTRGSSRGSNGVYEGKMTPRGYHELDKGEMHARQKMGPPPSISAATTTTTTSTTKANHQPTLGVVSRRELMKAMDLTAVLSDDDVNIKGGGHGGNNDGGRGGGRGSGRSGRPSKVIEIQVNQYKPPSKKEGIIQTSPINKTTLGNSGRSDFTDLETSGIEKQLKERPSPEEMKKMDGKMFDDLMDHCKTSGYFQDYERGTTEYNMKIHGLINIFEQWKETGRNGSLLQYSGLNEVVEKSRRQETPPRRAASPYESKFSPPQEESRRTVTTPTSAEKSRNKMFQAFLNHARSRGFFDGCQKGTQEYNLKVSQCIVKFEELRAKQGYPDAKT